MGIADKKTSLTRGLMVPYVRCPSTNLGTNPEISSTLYHFCYIRVMANKHLFGDLAALLKAQKQSPIDLNDRVSVLVVVKVSTPPVADARSMQSAH